MRRSGVFVLFSVLLGFPVYPFQASTSASEPAVPPLASNQLAPTPPMGWTSGKRFAAGKLDDKTVRETADALVTSGLRDVGYRYVVVDDGWQGGRDATGKLVGGAGLPDPKATAIYLQQQGLHFGLTSGAEEKACGGAEGSAGHEEADAQRFAEWGVDYLKYEWCGGKLQPTAAVRAAARKMAEALRATRRAVVFTLVPRGVRSPELWAAASGANSWRMGPDLAGTWESLRGAFDVPARMEESAGPGRWNELDAMQCTAGLTPGECRVEMSLRALMATPIFLGDDVRNLPPAVREVIANQEVVAIHQDALGRPGKKIDKWQEKEIWARPLSNGAYAVGLFNRGNDTAVIKVSWESLDLPFSPLVRDIWKQKSLGRPDDGVSVPVGPHGVALLRLSR